MGGVLPERDYHEMNHMKLKKDSSTILRSFTPEHSEGLPPESGEGYPQNPDRISW